jgi:hypothetical protein
MFETVLEFVSGILLGLVPNRRAHYVWWATACILILLACSVCMFIAELAIQYKR